MPWMCTTHGPSTGSLWGGGSWELGAGCCAGQLYKASDGVFLKLDGYNMELPYANGVYQMQARKGLRDLASGAYSWTLLVEIQKIALVPSANICPFHAGPSIGLWWHHGVNNDCPGLSSVYPHLMDTYTACGQGPGQSSSLPIRTSASSTSASWYRWAK